MNGNPLHERKVFLEETEAHLRQGDHLKVLSLAEARLKQTPGDMDARIAICRVWIEQERLEEAGEMLQEMEDILAGLSQIYSCMGDIYLRKGMAESAQDFYRTFVTLSPETPMAHRISERLKGLTGQPVSDGPEDMDQEADASIPGDFQTVTLAELYARQGHLGMAEEVLASILSRGPHHPKAAALLREVRDRIARQEQTGQSPGTAMRREGEESPEGIADQEKPQAIPAAELPSTIHESLTTHERSGGEIGVAMRSEDDRGETDRQEQEAHGEPLRAAAFERREATPGVPGRKPVALLIRDLEALQEKLTAWKQPVVKQAALIAELSRWQKNIGRLGSHAG